MPSQTDSCFLKSVYLLGDYQKPLNIYRFYKPQTILRLFSKNIISKFAYVEIIYTFAKQSNKMSNNQGNIYIKMAYDKDYFMENYHKMTFIELLYIQKIIILTIEI